MISKYKHYLWLEELPFTFKRKIWTWTGIWTSDLQISHVNWTKIAQVVERQARDLEVRGSNSSTGSNIFSWIKKTYINMKLMSGKWNSSKRKGGNINILMNETWNNSKRKGGNINMKLMNETWNNSKRKGGNINMKLMN